MVRAHFKKPSSTFSPVRALVSRNISSVGWGGKSKTLIRQVRMWNARLHNLISLTVFLSKAWSFQESHLPVCVQILLVATQDNNDVGARQCPCICQPVSQGIVGLSTARTLHFIQVIYVHFCLSLFFATIYWNSSFTVWVRWHRLDALLLSLTAASSQKKPLYYSSCHSAPPPPPNKSLYSVKSTILQCSIQSTLILNVRGLGFCCMCCKQYEY